ncbi:MAG: SLC13 family permease, partial [Chloroflexota bacterium]
MTPEITLTLFIILAALVLFATEKLRVDVVALLVLITVGVLGLIPRDELFSGFSNSAVVTVWAVYMVSGALFKTGVADTMGKAILRVAGNREASLIGVIMLAVGGISAFMNNVGAVAVLLPAVVSISKRTRVPASKLLIPLAFASLLGGSMTLIGTPANILAAGILLKHGLPTFGFFEFLPMGIVVLTVGVLYMVLLGRKLLPVRPGAGGKEPARQLRDYITEVRVSQASTLIGKTLYESRLGQEYDLNVLAIERDDGSRPILNREAMIQSDDLLLVESSAADLLAAQKALDLTIWVEQGLDVKRLEPGETQIIEVTLKPSSPIADRKLGEVRFRDRYGFTALAISRQGHMITQRLRDVPLKLGDALLLQGPRHRVSELQEGADLLVLEPVETEQYRRGKAPIAVGALLLAIALVVFAGMEISLAMVIAATITIVTGALTVEEAYESVDWRTVFLVAGMLTLGLAMEETGTARYLADLMLGSIGTYGPLATLAGVYLLAALVTQPMSNAA